MKKEDLRKAVLTQHSDGSGAYTIEVYFHKWGDFPMPTDDGRDIPRTLGIVELVSDGTIDAVLPKRIKFIDKEVSPYRLG